MPSLLVWERPKCSVCGKPAYFPNATHGTHCGECWSSLPDSQQVMTKAPRDETYYLFVDYLAQEAALAHVWKQARRKQAGAFDQTDDAVRRKGKNTRAKRK